MKASMTRSIVIAISLCAGLSGCATYGGLYNAAQSDDMAAVQKMVNEGCDVNAKGDFGQTALYQAAANGNVAMTRLLLDKGADPNVMAVGMTPLLGAIWRGHTEVVRLLVERGANVNLASNWMSLSSPIHYCGAYGNAEIARILVAAGADVNARDKKGKTAADFAKEYKKDEVLAVLVKAGVPLSYSGNAAKDIVMAMISGDRDKVRQLVEGGVDPNSRDKAGKSLLAYSVENKWPDVVKLLIEKGADANEKDGDGWTLMMKAAFENQTETMKMLESAGVKASYSGDLRDDILKAVLFGDREKVKALIAQGADVNGKYRLDSPLLNYSVYKNDFEMTKLLLENKADPNVVNSKGYNPLVIGLQQGRAPMGRLLLEHGAAPVLQGAFPSLPFAVMTGDAGLVRLMLAKGAQPDAGTVKLAEGRDEHYKNVNFPEIAALLKPELLRRQMLRAQAAVEAAQSAEDYQKAIAEYTLAKEIAPEMPEIYYNLGLVQEKAGTYAEAIVSLQKYLELSPAASDAQAVKDMIYKLEYKKEQQRNR